MYYCRLIYKLTTTLRSIACARKIICTWQQSCRGYHIYCSNITTSFIRSYFKSSSSSRRVIAHLPLRLSVDEAAAAAVRLGGAGSSHTRRAGAVTTKFSTEAEEDGGQEEASHGCPGETHEITADVGFRAGRAEGVAALDNPYAVCC